MPAALGYLPVPYTGGANGCSDLFVLLMHRLSIPCIIIVMHMFIILCLEHDGFTIQVQQISQIEKTHSLSPCKMESPQDQL
ncbi:hypothetical protein ATX44_08290 [Oenococcus oeni]|nr:hypothetical protein ATX44_08290 [Oenococcus oeni]